MRIIATFLIFFSFDLFSANREVGNSTLQFVGKIKFPNHRCSGFIAKHGLLVTAKHCFNHFDIDPDNFKPKGVSVIFPGNKSEVVITSIEKLIFDSGENDIAYLTYEPSQTLNFIDLGDFKISNDIDLDLDIFRAGFSGEETYSGDRILTQGCKFNKKKGHFPAMVTDPGYEGLLFDSECPAWFGDSGGPVISFHEGKFVIVGILSHTFEVDFAGDILPESIERDSFGRYVKTSIVSPFSEALDIWNLLDL